MKRAGSKHRAPDKSLLPVGLVLCLGTVSAAKPQAFGETQASDGYAVALVITVRIYNYNYPRVVVVVDPHGDDQSDRVPIRSLRLEKRKLRMGTRSLWSSPCGSTTTTTRGFRPRYWSLPRERRRRSSAKQEWKPSGWIAASRPPNHELRPANGPLPPRT